MTGGTATFDGQDILAMEPESAPQAGMFLAFQAPVELPGVGNANFLRTALNAVRRARGETELDAAQFLKLARAEARRLQMPDDMLKRNVNVGFSGGEKKRNEVLQMTLLQPSLAILDETDSGLDIDALKIVGGRGERAAWPGILRPGHHPSPAPAGPYRAGPRACAGAGPHRALRRAGTGARAGSAWLRGVGGGGLMTALPTRQLEAWRYTDLKALAAMSFATPAAPPVPVDLPDLGVPRLVFVNGVYDAARSTPPGFMRTFVPAAPDEALPLAAINAEQARDGMTLDVPAGVDAGVVLLVAHAGAAEAASVQLRHRITLGHGASLTLLEVAAGQGVYWHNPVTEIMLAEQATLNHYRLQDESAEAFHLATILVELAATAVYNAFSLVLGARLSRAEVHARLTGPGANAHLNAAQLLRGRQHGDITTVVSHLAPACASRQTVKSVLADQARGVFQGKVAVDRIAQKTDGYQMSQALLLSPRAEMDVKPELEIFADDVKCSHGATIGALDPEQLFYLRSRGIPEEQARAMLIRAFLTEALEPVTWEPARALFETAIDNWWQRP